ncbi:phospholipase-like protein [Tanacetum coccineum]
MDLNDYEVSRVLVACRSKEEFCLVSELKFGVENLTDYNNAEEPIPFRRRVFSSSLDGQPIRRKNVETLIKSEAFKKLDDNDAVSLCCVGILQLVLLGLEDRRPVPNWILRLANDIEGWDKYPWGSHSTDEIDKKSYSITGFAWAFKTWILESFRAAKNDYYTRYRRLPRIVAWSSKNKFYRNMLNLFLHGQLPVERLVPDEIEARSRWWVSSRAYFDGRNIEDERIPRHLNRNNYFEVPSEMYREFEEQRRGYKKMMEKSDDMYEKMSRFMEDMRVGPVPQANKEPIIADQHYGIIIYVIGKEGNTNRVYMLSPYTVLPPTTVLPKKRTDKTKKKSKAAKLSPLNLGNTFIDENVSREDILIREREENDNWTLSKSGTICLHPENNSFMILTDPHIIGTLDGSMRPYPSWKNVNWVYMPINAGGVHWVTGAINLADSIFYVFDSMESESRMLMLEQQVRDWTPVINRILQMHRCEDTENCGYD